VGVGVGAAGGAAVGAAIGAVGGPVGVAVGAAVVRSRADWRKGVAEVIDPTAEDEHWAAHYSGTSYVKPGADYKTHQPAYRYGWESFQRYPGRSFDAVEPATRTATEGSPCSGPPEKPAPRPPGVVDSSA